MKRWVKIILMIIFVYLVISTLFHIILLYFSVKSQYSEQSYNYLQSKLCYECATGEKSGVCPKINRDEGLAGYEDGVNATYPNANEYTGTLPRVYGGYPLDEKRKLKISEINDELIIQNDYCYYRDWTERADYLSDFVPKPNKSKMYLDSLTNPSFYLSIIVGPVYWVSCLFYDCSF